jgi:hypothetical protein
LSHLLSGVGTFDHSTDLSRKARHHSKHGEHKEAFQAAKEHIERAYTQKHLNYVAERMRVPLGRAAPDPAGLVAASDYIRDSLEGQEALHKRSKAFFGTKAKAPADAKAREALGARLEGLSRDPSALLEVGGSLGHYLPEHATNLAASMAQAVSYLEGMRPKSGQSLPLDARRKPNKLEKHQYERALDIAHDPLSTIQHASEGTLLAQDVRTLSTLYPGLHKEMMAKLTEDLIDHDSRGGDKLPYRKRQGLSLLLGTPLDSTMTPQAAMAAMRANVPAPQPQAPKAPRAKASGTELTQINKVNALSETPLEAREVDRVRH